MRGWIQDCLRSIIGLGITGLGLALQMVHLFKIRDFLLESEAASAAVCDWCRYTDIVVWRRARGAH